MTTGHNDQLPVKPRRRQALEKGEWSCPVTNPADGKLGRAARTAGRVGMERCLESVVQSDYNRPRS